MSPIAWNIITRNIQPDEQTQREIRQKLARLEEHFKAYSSDELHLQVPEDVVPNPEAVPPDRLVEEKELLEHLQDAIRSWPRPEREVFELYFVRGFEPGEIAQITREPLKQVKGTLATVQARLREEFLQADPRLAA